MINSSFTTMFNVHQMINAQNSDFGGGRGIIE
jgi:hypothetical protein